MSHQQIIHRFLRQPNLQSSIYNRVGNRYNPFANTLQILQDPKQSRKLYLIGTTNSSTTLAYRTKKLIEQIKPSSVYVQASNNWWNNAKHLDVSNQQQFADILSTLPQVPEYQFANHLRGMLWRIRYYTWVTGVNLLAGFPHDFSPFTPGLETKFALEEATRVGSNIHFGGSQFDPIAMEALRVETDMYLHTALWRSKIFLRSQNAWNTDFQDFKKTLQTRGGEAFGQSFDKSRANFMVQALNKIAPKQKKVLVDLRDQRIFRDLYKTCEGDTIVAVINQWHTHGVQTHWRRTTGTVVEQQQQSPVADMNIDQYQQRHVINEYLRDRASKITNSEPATHQDMITSYHKQNFEYERTRHTHHDSHEDIPNPGQEPKHHH